MKRTAIILGAAAALAGGLPVDDLLDPAGKREVLVGDAVGGMVPEPHLDGVVGGGDVGMVPGGFRQVADGIDDHERALPARRGVSAPDAVAVELPLRQFGLQSLPHVPVAIGLFRAALAHRQGLPFAWRFDLSYPSDPWTSSPGMEKVTAAHKRTAARVLAVSSQVVYGPVGNSAAVPGMQKLGLEDWLRAHTVNQGLRAHGFGQTLLLPWPGGSLPDWGSAVARTELDDHLRTVALCELAAAFAAEVLAPGGALVLTAALCVPLLARSSVDQVSVDPQEQDSQDVRDQR